MWTLWLACAEPGATVVAPEASSIADLWLEVATAGARVSVPARVISPRTADRESFYVQDPVGGPGLRVSLRGHFPLLPPPIGTELEISGTYTKDGDGPVLLFEALEDAVVSEDVSEPVLAAWPTAPALGLVRAEVLVTSPPDPLDEAASDVVALDGMFRVPPPGWHARAAVVGVMVAEGRLAPRLTTDWTVTAPGEGPMPTEIAALGDQAPGSWVSVSGTQATPWSADGRFVLLQDAAGRGVWVDTEGFGVDRTSVEGDLMTVNAELRQPILRCWESPRVSGTGPIVASGAADGAIVEGTLTPSGEPDAWGARPSLEGPRVGNRFAESSLDTPITGRFAVASDPGGLAWHPY